MKKPKVMILISLLAAFLLVSCAAEDTEGEEQAVPANQPPIANAGDDQTVNIGDSVQLTAAASSDADGDTLSYGWEITVKPEGSEALLASADKVETSIIPDIAGTYVVSLTVNDGHVGIAKTVTITVNNADQTSETDDTDSAQETDSESTNGTDNTQNTDGTSNSDICDPTENEPGSADPNDLTNNDNLTYKWFIDSQPAGSTVNLSSSSDNSISISPDLAGTYVISFIGNDGTEDSKIGSLTLTKDTQSNNVPVADAGSDQYSSLGDAINLSGSASYDNDGDSLTYKWSIDFQPSGSIVNLDSTTNVSTSITPDVAGMYVISLIVNDGIEDSQADILVITVSNTISASNNVPIADAGPNIVTDLGKLVVISGLDSYDDDGDNLTYKWSIDFQPSGSIAILDSMTNVYTSITPDVAGTYVISLIVNDGIKDSQADILVITVNNTISASNNIPIADAGPNVVTDSGKRVVISGLDSYDDDGDNLTYKWSIDSKPSGSIVSLDSTTIVSTSITPDVIGTYDISLIVNDGTEDSQADTMTITVENAATASNSVPTADAGPNVYSDLGSVVTLSGSGSHDDDGDRLTYKWSIDSQPAGSTASLDTITGINTSITPDLAGSYTISLIVNDGTVDSQADTITITVEIAADQINSVPIADAGSNVSIDLGKSVNLIGSGSYDDDGEPLTYRWSLDSQPAGSTASLDTNTQVFSSITPDLTGSYTISLIVNDGTEDSQADTITITVENAVDQINSVPIADAGSNVSIDLGKSVNLIGSGSYDNDGEPLTYKWSLDSQPADSTVTLNSTENVYSAITPDVIGSYVISLIVNDGTEPSQADTITITVIESVTADTTDTNDNSNTTNNIAPVADAGSDQSAYAGVLVSLDASGSYDGDSDSLTYRWFVDSRPEGSNVQLASTLRSSTTITPDVAGTYVIGLIVNDGTQDSQTDTITINVSEALPETGSGACIISMNLATLGGYGSAKKSCSWYSNIEENNLSRYEQACYNADNATIPTEWTGSCPTSNVVGTCTFTVDGISFITSYYNDFYYSANDIYGMTIYDDQTILTTYRETCGNKGGIWN